MTSQSPQRNRKLQLLTNTQAQMQSSTVPRENTPSPSFRAERQRAIKAHSMPIVPSLNQVLDYTPGQHISHQQPSPTTSNSSHQSRNSPPPASRISPIAAKLASGNLPNSGPRDDPSPERLTPPPLIHAHSQPTVSQTSSTTQAQPNVLAHHPRPINRVAPPPQFLSHFQTTDEKFQMTAELMAGIDGSDEDLQGQLKGTSGVAYAGGARSTMYTVTQHTIATTVRDPNVERIRANDRSSPKDQDTSAKWNGREKEGDRDAQLSRESPKTRERSQTTSSVIAPHSDPQLRSQDRSPEYRSSPQYPTPMTSPNERTAGYTQYVSDSYLNSQSQPPASSRKPPPGPADSSAARGTPPKTVSNQSPSLQPASVSRTSERSLPLQEEPEEDVGHDLHDHEPDYHEHRISSPTPSDLYPDGHGRYDERRGHRSGREDDEETLNEEADEKRQEHHSGEDESSGFTPRSPSVNLPERPRDGQYSPTSMQFPSSQYSQPNDNQKTIRVKHRNGSTDHSGLRTFDPAMFQQTVNTLRGTPDESSMNGHRPQQQQQQARSSPSQQYTSGQYQNGTRQQPPRVDSVMTYASNTLPSHLPSSIEDMSGLQDDPTSSYLRRFYQQPGARPDAPIPPTPHSQTAAPSVAPSPPPAISAMPSEMEARQIGSPYPYPFTHIRRMTVPSTTEHLSQLDPQAVAQMQEDFARQWHTYLMNNRSYTTSPSTSAFPGSTYNPMAYVHQAALERDANMSLRSSPSHEPVSLPAAPALTRGLRRPVPIANARPHINGSRRKVKPPPRVESTQPRDTSPEPSSGEETPGEDQYINQYLTAAADDQWTTNGDDHNGHQSLIDAEDEEGEWVDESVDVDDDILQLEYHPTFISRVEKRRRRWETRWDALAEAFHSLDRETDTTLVLLAAPSHSNKLHHLTSRSIRRDPSLLNSDNLSSLRSSFRKLATKRKNTRTRPITLADQLSSVHSSPSVGGSPGNSETREGELRQALDAALRSLNALGQIYETREARWREEMKRVGDDRERVELLLRQTLGSTLFTNGQQS